MRFIPQDKQYMEHLADLVRLHLGDSVVIYTVDGASDEEFARGSLDFVFAYATRSMSLLFDAASSVMQARSAGHVYRMPFRSWAHTKQHMTMPLQRRQLWSRP